MGFEGADIAREIYLITRTAGRLIILGRLKHFLFLCLHQIFILLVLCVVLREQVVLLLIMIFVCSFLKTCILERSIILCILANYLIL